MKKNLLLLAGALAVGSAAWAIEGNQVIPGTMITQISPAGTFAGGVDFNGTAITVIDLADGETTVIAPEEDDYYTAYSPGMGNWIADDGTIVGSVDSSGMTAYYWEVETEEWFPLPVADDDVQAHSQGICGDGSRICGQVGKVGLDPDAEVPMNIPVIWYRNAKGGYNDYIVLPHPETDFSGRCPQYITAVCISADGKTVVGQICDYSGYVNLPIVYTEDEEGEWSYKVLWDANPTGIDLGPEPELPAYKNLYDFATDEELAAWDEATDIYYEVYYQKPYEYNYMTEEELDQYNDALIAYYNDWQNNPYPQYKDFMTEEEYAEYEAAYDEWLEELGSYPTLYDFISEEGIAAYEAYQEEYDEAYAAWSEWDDALWDLLMEIPGFEFNNIMMSQDGNKVVTSAITYGWWENTVTTYLFDVAAGTYEEFTPDVDILASYVNNDGAILGGQGLYSADRTAYIKPADAEEFVDLLDYVAGFSAETADWMKENMTHTYYEWDYVWNDETWTWEEVTTEVTNTFTGTPVATPDLSLIATWAYNCWDYSDACYSYLIDLRGLDSVADAVVAEGAVTTEYYDLQGRRVANTNNLKNGIYIVRTIDANGKATAKTVKF